VRFVLRSTALLPLLRCQGASALALRTPPAEEAKRLRAPNVASEFLSILPSETGGASEFFIAGEKRAAMKDQLEILQLAFMKMRILK
jgi:hypothetical protein